MNLNPLSLPQSLARQAADDVRSIAEAARGLADLPVQLLERLDRLEGGLMSRLDALMGVPADLGALRGELAPIAQLPAVLDAVAPLASQIADLRAALTPIEELAAMREAVAPLSSQLDGLQHQLDVLREAIRPIEQLAQVRVGIEPLDDDLLRVRESIEKLEPIVKGVADRVAAMDVRLGALAEDVEPIGELAHRIPGGKRK